MSALPLHDLHRELHAHFGEVNGMEVVEHYGDWRAEYDAFSTTAGVVDLSCRSRMVLTGEDRVRFLNGQVTNEVKRPVGQGCYAALITNKGKMQSDANIYLLPNEILLDFEPGLTGAVSGRLDKFIIADDVQIIDAAPHYGLLSVQGPRSWEVVERLALDLRRPEASLHWTSAATERFGEIYCMNLPRLGTQGYDLFVPIPSLREWADHLIAAVRDAGGRTAGWRAMETARIEAGIPRFLAEMDETNLPPEAGIEAHAISYTKGCYIGQEVIARIRTYGQVAKALRGLRLDGDDALPVKGDKLRVGPKEAGYVTSAIHSPALQAPIALAYVRREHNAIGTELTLSGAEGERKATVVALPFRA